VKGAGVGGALCTRPKYLSQVRDCSICDHCGQAAGSVFVHGHYQCLACHSVQIPCCEGAAASTSVASGSRRDPTGKVQRATAPGEAARVPSRSPRYGSRGTPSPS
jgi:hypothetical protein